MRDPYDVLGVAKNASAKDIKSAFRKLAKKYHPDQNPDDPKAKERFAAASQAYDVIGDEKNRAAFDRGEIDAEGKPRFQGFAGAGAGGDPFGGFRQQGPGGQRFEFRSSGPRPGASPFGGDAGDIFSEIFGQAFRQGGAAGPQPSQGEDLSASMDVSLEDAASGGTINVAFPDGRKLAVKLPRYVEDGQTIRLKGQATPPMPGMRPGDALVKVRFRKHPSFTLDGRDLHLDLPVSLKDAVLGAKVPVETLSGRVAVTVPPWSSSDKVLRLKGRGLPLKTSGEGDLYVHVRVMLPETGREEIEALVSKL